MKQETVAVIGCNGGYGKWLMSHSQKQGYHIIGSDILTIPSNKEAVLLADVVIFAVPIRDSVSVMESVVHNRSSHQLWLDVTGLKERQVEAMMKSGAEVVGMHPMCAPPHGRTLRGQTLIACPARLNRWKTWFENFAASTEANYEEMSPTKHDKTMAVSQSLLHTLHLALANTFANTKVDVEKTLMIASPIYRMALSHLGRVLKQDPELYIDMMLCNPYVCDYASSFLGTYGHILSAMENSDRLELRTIFARCRDHFGPHVLEKSFELFENLNGLVADLYSKNLIVFATENDSPGILSDILRVIATHGVNLVSAHSRRPREGRNEFILQYSDPVDPSTVKLMIDDVCEKHKTICVQGRPP